ncbi:hypothetical protein ABZX30_28720 [Streptomyces sp. NPDC004542]|uniref:hypothetical protein n=1 Tax=Streptomyces sp. NPDC004542 TaxID=3154281 RepID=UPI0033A4C705
MSSPRGLAELNRKLRHREVPGDPEERATIRRLVAEYRARVERGNRGLPYWLGFMGLSAALMLAAGVVTGSWTYPLVFTIGTVGFCCLMLWMRRRSLDRARSMHSALRSESGQAP